MEERVPCSDEMCVGTIGPDGTCRYCGKPYEGELPAGLAAADDDEGAAAADDDAAAADDDDEGDEGAGALAGDAPGPEEDGFVPFGDDRVPCSDEMCTGTIGDDGKCRYCGKSAR